LKDRVKTVEQGGNYEYVIDEIKTINPNVEIDVYVNIINDNGSYSIQFEMNEKFFQYYRRTDADNNLDQFGGRKENIFIHNIYTNCYCKRQM
jgi:hypothetical protein